MVKVSYPLRIDEELMNQVKLLAERESRSLNKQFEFLIKTALNDLGTPQAQPEKKE